MHTFITLVVVGLLAGFAGRYVMKIHGKLMAAKINGEKSWSAMDLLLKQWHDEIPKWVDVCRGSVGNDQYIYERTNKARQNLMYAKGPAAKRKAEEQLSGILKELFALADTYPALKAQVSYHQALARNAAMNSQIINQGKSYNDFANIFNIRLDLRPDIFVARVLGMEQKELFK